MKKIKYLAQKIVNYSCHIKRGQKVTIQMTGDRGKPLVLALINEVNAIGASVVVITKEPAITAALINGITVENAKSMAKRDLEIIADTDVYIMVKSIEDHGAMAKVSKEHQAIYGQYYTTVINPAILETTRWVSLRYPNQAIAERADMSLSEFEDYYFQVCTMDYDPMSKAMDYLVDQMERTDKVHITGHNTDISFSIKGLPVHKCDGIINLPDGEVYTSPVRNSINGYINYNVPSIYNGVEFNNVYFQFDHGKIVQASCGDESNTTALEGILNLDEGARYIGEFALGVNPFIKNPIKDILFDEKLAGSFHLTPGFSYKDAFNGNESAVHWDLICIQTDAYGGGEIYFDGVLIRKNGMFLAEELQILNPK